MSISIEQGTPKHFPARHCLELLSSPLFPCKFKTEQPALTALDPRYLMLVEVRPKQYEPPEQVEQSSFANEFPTRFGLDQDPVELEQPACRDHVQVRQYAVALRVSNQINIQAPGPKKYSRFHIGRHCMHSQI